MRAGSPAPGEQAFRADAEALLAMNPALADEKAAAEGITVEELGELTYLGMLAMRLRQWEAVERQLGHELSPALRAEADLLVFASSDELKATIRAQVARGEPEAARWATIRWTEDTFVADYVALVGLDAAGFDALLGESFAEPP